MRGGELGREGAFGACIEQRVTRQLREVEVHGIGLAQGQRLVIRARSRLAPAGIEGPASGVGGRVFPTPGNPAMLISSRAGTVWIDSVLLGRANASIQSGTVSPALQDSETHAFFAITR